MAINYCIVQNFRMSLISQFSQIFNSSRKYLGFVTRHTVLMLCLQSIDRQYPGAMLLNLHGKFSKYIPCMPCPQYITCVACTCSGFTKFISTKSSKITICENFKPWKFSAIWYTKAKKNKTGSMDYLNWYKQNYYYTMMQTVESPLLKLQLGKFSLTVYPELNACV